MGNTRDPLKSHSCGRRYQRVNSTVTTTSAASGDEKHRVQYHYCPKCKVYVFRNNLTGRVIDESKDKKEIETILASAILETKYLCR